MPKQQQHHKKLHNNHQHQKQKQNYQTTKQQQQKDTMTIKTEQENQIDNQPKQQPNVQVEQIVKNETNHTQTEQHSPTIHKEQSHEIENQLEKDNHIVQAFQLSNPSKPVYPSLSFILCHALQFAILSLYNYIPISVRSTIHSTSHQFWTLLRTRIELQILLAIFVLQF